MGGGGDGGRGGGLGGVSSSSSFVLKQKSVFWRAAFCRHSSCFCQQAGLRSERGEEGEAEGEGEGRSVGGGVGEFGESRDAELFKTPLEVGGAHVTAPQRAMDVLLEEPPVRLEDFCRLLVQRILGVRLLQGGGWGRTCGGHINTCKCCTHCVPVTVGAGDSHSRA